MTATDEGRSHESEYNRVPDEADEYMLAAMCGASLGGMRAVYRVVLQRLRQPMLEATRWRYLWANFNDDNALDKPIAIRIALNGETPEQCLAELDALIAAAPAYNEGKQK